MKKVGVKILLCLVLCITLLSSSFTVFADKVGGTGFFSTLESVENMSDYIGRTQDMVDAGDESLMVRSEFKYAFVFEDNGRYYLEVDEGEKNLASVNDIDESDFRSFSKDSYYCSTPARFISSLTVLVLENDTVKYVGTITSWDNVPVISIEYDSTPIISLSTEKVDEVTAKINVDCSLSDGFKKFSPANAVILTITLQNDNAVFDTIYATSDDNRSFIVTSNGEYEVVVTTPISSGSKKITIDSLSTDLPDDLVEDTEAPVITFSSLPESAVKGDAVEVTMYSDEPAILNFNGVTSDDYVTEFKTTLKYNGNFYYSAVDKYGNSVESTLEVTFFGDNPVDDAERDDIWGDVVDMILPQTGGAGLVAVIIVGVVIVGGGIFFIVKKKKKSVKSDEEPKEEVEE